MEHDDIQEVVSMNACFSEQKEEDVTSTVFNHVGSAPAVAVVDADSNAASTIENCAHH